jgi:hypothetical protein
MPGDVTIGLRVSLGESYNACPAACPTACSHRLANHSTIAPLFSSYRSANLSSFRGVPDGLACGLPGGLPDGLLVSLGQLFDACGRLDLGTVGKSDRGE